MIVIDSAKQCTENINESHATKQLQGQLLEKKVYSTFFVHCSIVGLSSDPIAQFEVIEVHFF